MEVMGSYLSVFGNVVVFPFGTCQAGAVYDGSYGQEARAAVQPDGRLDLLQIRR
jgi:hypothetical protein